MGLFSKKVKELEYDAVECKNKKEIMRNIFNEAVADGESFEILHAMETSTKFKRGLVTDTTTTTYYHYILGYRKRDDKMLLVQVNRDLTEHSEPWEIDLSLVENISYNPKLSHANLIYKKGTSDYGEILNIGDTGSKTMYGISNTMQKEEREKFLDYLETLRAKLEARGFKQEKWKR